MPHIRPFPDFSTDPFSAMSHSHQAEPTEPSPIALLLSVLRDACRQAIDPNVPLADVLRLFRSVVALARSVPLIQADIGDTKSISTNDPLHRENPDLAALVTAVLAAACGRALTPHLPLPQVIGLHRVIVSLERAARLARRGQPQAPATAKNNAAQHLMHREKPPAPAPQLPPRRPAMPWDFPDPMRRRNQSPRSAPGATTTPNLGIRRRTNF